MTADWKIGIDLEKSDCDPVWVRSWHLPGGNRETSTRSVGEEIIIYETARPVFLNKMLTVHVTFFILIWKIRLDSIKLWRELPMKNIKGKLFLLINSYGNVLNIYYYYYYYYYLSQLSFHSVTVVLTLVQTKQIRMNIHKRNNTKKTQYKQYTTK